MVEAVLIPEGVVYVCRPFTTDTCYERRSIFDMAFFSDITPLSTQHHTNLQHDGDQAAKRGC